MRQHQQVRKVAVISRGAGQSGQALLEFTFTAMILIVMAFGLIDFGRAIYNKQVITNLTREGSNLASRGTTLPDTATAVITGSAPLNLGLNGRVIVTKVTNTGSAGAGVFTIAGQESRGGISASSKIGSLGGTAALPTAAQPLPNASVYVTEVFYAFSPITPVGSLLSVAMPSTMYDIAYF